MLMLFPTKTAKRDSLCACRCGLYHADNTLKRGQELETVVDEKCGGSSKATS